MKKSYLLTTLVITLVIFGSSCLLYAIEAKDESKEILSLIEEGTIEIDNQRYTLALQKYREATTIIEDILTREPGNRRILLLKELLENKITECRREIDKIEQEIDKNFLYKKALEEAYILVERADQDIKNSKFYVALKKYNQAKEKIKFAVESVPGWQEPKLLLELVERRIISCREEIDRLSGISDRERLFSREIEKVMKIVEEASKDEEDSRFLIALQGYTHSLNLLENLEKEYPENARISLVREMVNIRVEGCKKKIRELERKIEAAAPPVPPKKIIEKIPPVKEVIKPAIPIEKEIKPEIPIEEEVVEEIVLEKPKPKKPVRIPKLRIAPVKTYLKTRVDDIKNFISLSRREGKAANQKANLANYNRTARLKEGLKRLKMPPAKAYLKTKTQNIKHFISKSRKEGKAANQKANLANYNRRTRLKEGLGNILSTLLKRPPKIVEKKIMVEKTAAVKVTVEAPPVKPAVEVVKELPEKPRVLPVVRSLEDYRLAPDVEVIIDGEKVEINKILIKDGDLWVNIKELADVLGTTLIHRKKKSFVILRTDGTPLGFEIGKKEIFFRNKLFYTLDRPILLFEDEPYAGFDALEALFNVEVDWRPSQKVLVLKSPHKKEEVFTAFTKPKPKELIEKERRERVRPPIIPKEEEMFKEKRLVPYTPPEILPDINVRVNNGMSYLHNNDPNNRTRVRSEYLTVAGKAYDYTFNSEFEWRDETTGTLVNQSKFIGVYGENTWFRFLNLYHDLAPLRSQSEGYEGFEATGFYLPYTTRIWGGRKEITVAGPSDVGSVKYYGKMGGIQQLYNSELLDLRGEVIGMINEAETHQKKGRTDFPRRNLVYMTDATVHLPAKLDLSGQYAVCNYNPDNQKDELIQDVNWRIEGVWDRLEEQKFLVRWDYEFLGTDYASLGIPSSYQDYEGLTIQTKYKPTKFLYLNTIYKQSQNNVDDVDSQPTTESSYIASNVGYYFPTNTSLNLSWTRGYTETTGPGEDYLELQGSLSNSYRVDLSQNWADLNLYLSYERYHLDARGSDTDSWSDTYSASLYKFLPAHRGSYIRLRHELKKAWYMASNNYTTITNNTDLGWRYHFTRDIYIYNDWFLRLTETEASRDTAYVSTRAGAFWQLDRDLSLGVDFNFDQRDLNNPSSKDWNEWNILFICNWGFEYNSPHKWAKIRGHVFRDLNANGIMDNGEEGIRNVLIIIPDEFMARTDKKGSYYMREVIPGIKTVKLDTKTLPMDLSVLYDNITEVTVNQRQTEEANFPLVVLNSIYGRAFIDENENNTHDIGEEGLEDINIMLFPEGRWSRTDENGKFAFEFVKPGQWELVIDTEAIPARYKLVSDKKIKVSLDQGEEVEDLYFIVRSKPVVKKVF